VAHEGQTVLIDLSGRDLETAAFMKLFWVWNSVLEYIESRQSRGHTLPPLGVVIDELSTFVSGEALNREKIISDFRKIVLERKRNANIWLTAATQEQRELPSAMLSVCLALGSLMFGATIDTKTALALAGRFDHLDTTKIKHREYHFGRELKEPAKPWWGTQPVLSGETKTFYTLAELEHMESQKYLNVPKEDWFLARSTGEGHVPRRLTRITTRSLDPGQYVNERLVGELKTRLMERDGVKVDQIIRELENNSETKLNGKRQQTLESDNFPQSPDTKPTNPMGRRRAKIDRS
jgi:hypothetical protein